MMNIEGEEMRKPIRLIAAACSDMGIGKNGQLPWSLPKEFQFFMDTITAVSAPGKKNLVVWGRICWFSCSETVFPLANCINLVLSRKLIAVPPRAHCLCKDFGSVIHLASEPPLCHIVETIWVLGGPEVYKESLEHPWCDLIYLTDIMADFDCDVFFPKFDRNVFRKQKGFPGVPDEIHEENGIKFQFQVFKKEA
ncbi:dihydrofolate reductase-like [Sinocyclocheilus anshuiensis]|uniref:dihydrofolate reductase-like n=1 Tax=Sinocyclocheilus anshuiensis TaxID=1608454 RepID=UPI0007B9241D|nr:PREDICTED: dihydrofolate reductase-like [Sinocyclocheilus anshuiensis]